ncbi:MAG: AraC family transcriptional regulator [Clostridiales bacterium]|jgi:AraC family transcriptional regulator of arabinose operon|nr:AraC family transcriptional regulator [Clostridiales bacterium]
MQEDIISFLNEETQTEPPFFIEMAGISYCDESYRIVRRNSPMYVFEYILEGEGTVLVEDKQFIAKKGDVYILHRQSNHEYFSGKTNPWTKIWFNAKGSLIDSLIQVYKLNNVNHIENCDMGTYFFQILNLAKQSKTSNPDFLKKASLLFYEMILSLYPNVHTETQTYTKEAGILKEHLDQNILNKVELKDLSQLIYHSNSQTIRIFKKAFGVTPYQYLMNQKLELAKLILLNTNKSIKEISSELKYYDEHYFSKYFREKVGMSPMAYRKKHQS